MNALIFGMLGAACVYGFGSLLRKGREPSRKFKALAAVVLIAGIFFNITYQVGRDHKDATQLATLMVGDMVFGWSDHEQARRDRLAALEKATAEAEAKEQKANKEEATDTADKPAEATAD